MKIALLFGTFNPPHKGHFHIIDLSFKQFDIDEVWIVPTPQNPLKKKDDILDFDIRYSMLNKIIDEINEPKIKILDIEKKLPTPNYTYMTIDLIHKQYPQHSFYLILGEDNINIFHKWMHYDKILEKIKIIAYRRNNKEITQNNFNFLYIKHPIENISSTEAREKIKNKEDYKDIIPWTSLQKYIKENNFYSN